MRNLPIRRRAGSRRSRRHRKTRHPIMRRQAKSRNRTNEMTKQDEDTGQESPLEVESEDDSLQQTGSAVSITIVSGDGSYTVAKKLEDAGAVFSASDYDNYLCQNGYDKRLRTGTFQIPAGASNEQIARIVTGQP